MKPKIALIGGRGYTGSEFLQLLAGHPVFSLSVATSRSQAGQKLSTVAPAWTGSGRCFATLAIDRLASISADYWVLALPNQTAGQWAQAVTAAHRNAAILDLSADARTDSEWHYGLPELNRAQLAGSRRIANPGCYATAAQLALAPLKEEFADAPSVFAVSGYSGAGRLPSDRNHTGRLKDNLLPYKLAGHVHEREISHHLGCDVRFMPHVAPFFRGISLTIAATLKQPADVQALFDRYQECYAEEPFMRITYHAPEINHIVEKPNVQIGGFTVDSRDTRRIVMVAVLDNLLKGAASQAMQNLNLMAGLDETTGIPND